MRSKALAGDENTAYQLYEYFTLHSYDEKESLRWVAIAAKLGNTKAQFAYADLALNLRVLPDRELATEYLVQAADGGHAQATKMLAKEKSKSPGLNGTVVENQTVQTQ